MTINQTEAASDRIASAVEDPLALQASLNNAIQIETPPPADSTLAAAIDTGDLKPPQSVEDVPRHLRRFIEADRRDAEQIRKWRNGESMKDQPRWIAPGIPHTYYAHKLAKEHGISHTGDEVFESKCEPGIWYACVWTQNPKNQRIQVGTAYWHDADTAKFFAYRNSIRQQLTGLCLAIGKSEKKIWRTTWRNAVRRHA